MLKKLFLMCYFVFILCISGCEHQNTQYGDKIKLINGEKEVHCILETAKVCSTKGLLEKEEIEKSCREKENLKKENIAKGQDMKEYYGAILYDMLVGKKDDYSQYFAANVLQKLEKSFKEEAEEGWIMNREEYVSDIVYSKDLLESFFLGDLSVEVAENDIMARYFFLPDYEKMNTKWADAIWVNLYLDVKTEKIKQVNVYQVGMSKSTYESSDYIWNKVIGYEEYDATSIREELHQTNSINGTRHYINGLDGYYEVRRNRCGDPIGYIRSDEYYSIFEETMHYQKKMNGKTPIGCLVSAEISEANLFIGEMVIDIVEKRGKVEGEYQEFFTEKALDDLNKFQWNSLGDDWKPWNAVKWECYNIIEDDTVSFVYFISQDFAIIGLNEESTQMLHAIRVYIDVDSKTGLVEACSMEIVPETVQEILYYRNGW